MHEASLHEDNCLVTLTYDDDHLPFYGTLDREAFPLFARRLRKRFAKPRYLMCGEYGEDNGRPHYHACLFGVDFPDKVQVGVRGEYPVWRSGLLEKLWPLGFSEVGTLTYESAQYVARYVLKKRKNSAVEYSRVAMDTGEVFDVEPEYATMSRRPGLGKGWIEKWKSEVFPSDEVLVNGKLMKPPRYYESQAPADVLAEVKRKRLLAVDAAEGSAKRLQVREVCAAARLNLHRREVK